MKKLPINVSGLAIRQSLNKRLRDKSNAFRRLWSSQQGECPAAIADMLDAIGSDELTKKHGETLATVWLERDAAAARLWIERSPLPSDVKQRLLSRADEEK